MRPNGLEGEASQCLPKHRHAVRESFRVLIGVLLGSLSPAALAQPASDFAYVTNDNAITITGAQGINVTIPATINGLPVTSIGDWSFWRDTSLVSITIPNSVTSIGRFAFWSCTNLTSVTIPSSIIAIGDGAFESCTGLTNVLLSEGLQRLGEQAFMQCTSLASVTIPDSVISIGEMALSDCESLTNLIIGTGVTSIPIGLCGNCFRLTTLTIPNSATNIEPGAFSGCADLTNVTIPNSVVTVGTEAFDRCFGLTYVTIGNHVTSIGDAAFQFCLQLTAIFFAGDAPRLGGTSVFVGAYGATIYYLAGSSGWAANFDGFPRALWNPKLHVTAASTNGLTLVVAGTADIPILLESATNLAHATWAPLHTCTLTNGLVSFSEPEWATNRVRFYRVSSP